jgi:peptidoglycan hydrolase-like protein with peptidoglycan-binding domain
MLISQLLGASADIQGIAAGARRMLAPEESDSVALIQEALVAVGFSLPNAGVDGSFGAETGTAVSAFKSSRGLSPTDPVVGVGTSNRLDLEVAYLEGSTADTVLRDTRALALDPYQAGFLEVSLGDTNLGQRVIDFFEFGDRICFRLSFALSGSAAQWMSEEIVEPLVFTDYRSKQAPVTSADFFDNSKSSTPYVNFLLAQHPTIDPDRLRDLGGKTRPDILRHRTPGSEWYEIKPASIAGAIGAFKKFLQIPKNYLEVGLPYLPGTRYTPTEDIPIAKFITPEGEKLDVIVHLFRRAPGLIFWELCIKGDYVQYFNRVRLVAGILAIIALLAELAVAAAASAEAAATAAAVLAALRQLALEFGLVLPILQQAQ